MATGVEGRAARRAGSVGFSERGDPGTATSVSPTMLVVDGPVALRHLWLVLAIAWIARWAGDAGRTTVAGFRRFRCTSPRIVRVIFADPRTSTALSTQLHRLGQFVPATFAHEVGYSSISSSPFRILAATARRISVSYGLCHLMARACEASQSAIIARHGTYRRLISHPPKALSETNAFAVGMTRA